MSWWPTAIGGWTSSAALWPVRSGMLSRCLMTFNAEPSIVPSRRSSDPQRAAARAASAAAALAYMHPDLIDGWRAHPPRVPRTAAPREVR